MLKDNLYRLDTLSGENGSYEAVISLIPESPVFAGHFPGRPIVPGVCLVQMAVEIIETIEGRDKEVRQAKDIRFLSVITPQECSALCLKLSKSDENGRWSVMILSGGELRSKFSISLCNA